MLLEGDKLVSFSRDWLSGMTYRELSRRYGLSRSQISWLLRSHPANAYLDYLESREVAVAFWLFCKERGYEDCIKIEDGYLLLETDLTQLVLLPQGVFIFGFPNRWGLSNYETIWEASRSLHQVVKRHVYELFA